MNVMNAFFLERLHLLDEWIVKNKYRAYDPFDGLSSSILNPVTVNNHFLRIAVQQFVRRFPINIRPLVGIRPQTSSKGMGFCALGYLKLHEATALDEYLEKAKVCLQWLIDHYDKGYSGYCWGNHFSYESRGGTIPLGVPTIVWTSLIANVFLDAFEYLGEQKYFDVAKSACDFIINDIGRYEESDGTICLMYTPQNKTRPSFAGCIHNSNVLGAWLLARVSKHNNEKELLSLAQKSIEFTLRNQLPDGGWYYGEDHKYRWVDSFHSGYVLESIHGYIKATGDKTKEDKLIKGYKHFLSTFFKRDGTPRYYDYKTYPIDIQCASQAIQTLVNLHDYHQSSMDVAKNVALWTIENLQDQKGYFYFRKYPFITNKTPTFHWGQATMLSALGHLIHGLKNSDDSYDNRVLM